MDKLDINVLAEMLENIRGSRPPENLQHFHLANIDNFIYHFGAIRHRKMRKLVYDSLYEYLTLVQSTEEISRIEGRDLFVKYLHPVAWVYVRYVGFVSWPGNFLLFHIYGIVFLIMYFLHVSRGWSLTITLLLFLYLTLLFIKKKKRKVHGFYLKID